MKDGKLNKREMQVLMRAITIINDWLDWEDEAREKAGFDATLDDLATIAINATNGIIDFYEAIGD